MRALLVNAFTKNPSRFKPFANEIRDQFKSIHDDCYMIEVNSSNLKDYLYGHGSKFTDKTAEKKFDVIDFVFIEGDPLLLPWQRRASQFALLMRMCIETRKPTFSYTFGAQLLIYSLAQSVPIYWINGQERGGEMKEMENWTSDDCEELKSTDVFLDNLTGNIYNYSREAQEFVPIGNVGLHKRSNKNHVAKIKSKIIADVGKYTACSVPRSYWTLWATKNFESYEFSVQQQNWWDPHPVHNGVQQIGEGTYGPMIILKNNTIACFFSMNTPEPNTIQILRNFWAHFKAGAAIGRPFITLQQAFDEKQMNADVRSHPRYSSPAIRRQPHVVSGYSVRKRTYRHLHDSNNSTTNQSIAVMKRQGSMFTEERSRQRPQSAMSFRGSFDRANNVSLLRKDLGLGSIRTDSDHYGYESRMPLNDVSLSTISQSDSREAVRTPDYAYDRDIVTAAPSLTSKVHMTSNPTSKPTLASNKSNLQNEPVKCIPRPPIRLNLSQTPYCRYNREFRSKISIDIRRTSSARPETAMSIMHDGEYVDKSKKELSKNRVSKDKWIGGEFRTIFGSGKTKVAPQKAFITASHEKVEFRKEERRKWIAGRFKVV